MRSVVVRAYQLYLRASDMTEDKANLVRDQLHHLEGFDVFETWKEYEKIAMHFNELLMRLRSQSLAAVAAFATVAGVIVRSDVSPHLRWSTLAGTFALLAVFWLAIWILDFSYYNRLLTGAVDALLELENHSGRDGRVSTLVLSTRIEAAVGRGSGSASRRRGGARWWFYGLVFAVLIAGLLLSTRIAISTFRPMGNGNPTVLPRTK